MRRRLMIAMLAAGLTAGLCNWGMGKEVEKGETRGTVVGTQVVIIQKVEVISVSILTNSATKQTLLVAPSSAGAYATAKELKTNDKVHAWWETTGGGKKWVTRLEVGAGK